MAEVITDPPVSEKQRRAMFAAAEGKSNLGIPEKVGKEFANADPGGKLPNRAHDHARLDAAIEKMDSLLERMGRGDANDQYPVKLTIELTQWDSLAQLIEFWRYIKITANGGHSFSIEADREEGDFHKNGGWPRVFIDGDGADKIGRILLNGEDVSKG